MKRIFTLIPAIFTFYGVYSQQPIRVYEDSLTYSKKKYPGVTVTIPEANYEKIQKDWKKELETKTKSKVIIENGEWSIFGANLKSLGGTPVNIYSRINNLDSLAQLSVAVELKKDVFVERKTSDPELLKLETYLKEFAKNQYIETANSQLKVEEDTLHQLKKKLSDYEKEESNLNETIKSSEKTIKEEGDNINALNTELESLNTEIENQNSQLASISDGNLKSEKSKYVKDLDKKKKKMRNDISSRENKIKKAEKDIKDAENEVPARQSQQAEIKKKIADQELKVQKYEQKVAAIKLY